jgi:hypothetical protein
MTLTEAALLLGNKLHDTSGEFLAQCRQWHNDSMFILLNRRKDWPFLEASGTLTTVAGQQQYSYVTDFNVSNLRRVASMRDPEGRPLKLVSIEDMDRKDPESTGRSVEIATWAQGLLMFPTPNQVETYGWRGYLKQAELDVSESPPWPDEFNPIWRMGAEAMGLQYLDDPRATQMWAMFYNSMNTMFGDNELEDEVIDIQPFSERSGGGFFAEPNGAVWP